jgi:hypothetical protein
LVRVIDAHGNVLKKFCTLLIDLGVALEDVFINGFGVEFNDGVTDFEQFLLDVLSVDFDHVGFETERNF